MMGAAPARVCNDPDVCYELSNEDGVEMGRLYSWVGRELEGCV
jgi:hypothetical protein